ncbi:hypothetical protein [Anabaena cylindrica]|uniref:hypothetical protein n=1 Tax=Anabaena cylindrica TaxID=1165 RepID=UPI001F553272|nr:hypothetical protein [Anabaena cylindrica]
MQWVLVNIVGLVGGGIVGAIAHEIFEPLGTILSSQAVAITIALTIGFMQVLVLRRLIPVSEKQWVLGTTLGVCISVLVCGDYPEYSLLWIGPIVGIIQWFILRQFVEQAGWWILVNSMFGWIGGVLSGAVLVLLLKNPKNK